MGVGVLGEEELLPQALMVMVTPYGENGRQRELTPVQHRIDQGIRPHDFLHLVEPM